jgi:outer membrane receptor protein involved in Fe transport
VRIAARLAFAASLLILFSRAPLQADQSQAVSGKELVRLGFFQDFEELDIESLLETAGGVTVSLATRGELTPEDAPGTVSVVTAEEIRQLGARTLADLLRTLPGCDVVLDSRGRSQLLVRGFPVGLADGASEGVLVLLDGQRLNEDVDGGASAVNLDLPLRNLRKVEVLRGPGSALYGEGALAAVINLVSSDTQDLLGTELSAGGGSFGTQAYSLRMGALLKQVTIAGFVRFADSDGPRLLVPADVQSRIDAAQSPGIEPASRAPGPTADRLRGIEAQYRLGYKEASLGFRLKNENAGGYVGQTGSLGDHDLNNRQFSLDARYGHSFASLGSLKGVLRYAQSERSDLNSLYPPGFTLPLEDGQLVFPSGIYLQTSLNTRRYGGEVVLERPLSQGRVEHQVSVGVSLEREASFDLDARGNADFRTLTPVSDDSLEPLPGVVADAARTSLGLFVQDSWKQSERLTLTGGVRFDHGSDFGSVLSPRLGAVLRLPRDMGLKLLYGRSYRAPTFAELRFDLPGLEANPGLSKTTAHTLEAVLSLRRRQLQASASVFASFVRDSIAPGAKGTLPGTRRLENLPGVDTRGVELELRRHFGIADSVFVNYSFLDAHDLDADRPVPGVSRHLATLGATLSVSGRLNVTPLLTLRSARPRQADDPRPDASGFALFDLNLRAPGVYRRLELALRLTNLFDKGYSDPSPSLGVPGDYPRAGRSVYVSAAWRF